MSKHLVRLKPLNPFFFGTNKTFSDETRHDVVSSHFPQQTHILGMLRFFLMQSNGLTKLRRRGRWVANNKYEEAFKIVGGYNKKDSSVQKESLGIINSLSPVFLISSKNNEVEDFHFIAPKDTGLNIEIENTSNYISIAGNVKDKQYFIRNYNPKNGYVSALTTSVFWKKYFGNIIEPRDYDVKIDKKYLDALSLKSFDAVFKEEKQVGIRRDSETKTVQTDDDGSFYNKVSYSFCDECYEFACIVDFEEDMTTKEAFVYLGAERSSFKMKIDPYTLEHESLFPCAETKKQIALSDIFLNNFDGIDFMLNDGYIAHAHMDRSKNKGGKASSKYNKSEQKYFIPKGSVVYFKDGFDVATLDTQIGYSTFITEKEK